MPCQGELYEGEGRGEERRGAEEEEEEEEEERVLSRSPHLTPLLGSDRQCACMCACT